MSQTSSIKLGLRQGHGRNSTVDNGREAAALDPHVDLNNLLRRPKTMPLFMRLPFTK